MPHQDLLPAARSCSRTQRAATEPPGPRGSRHRYPCAKTPEVSEEEEEEEEASFSSEARALPLAEKDDIVCGGLEVFVWAGLRR